MDLLYIKMLKRLCLQTRLLIGLLEDAASVIDVLCEGPFMELLEGNKLIIQWREIDLVLTGTFPEFEHWRLHRQVLDHVSC